MGNGKICVVTEWPLHEGFELSLLERSLMREGIHASQVTWLSLLGERPYAGSFTKVSPESLASGRISLCDSLRGLNPTVTLACGEEPLRTLTGKSSIDKWHSSVLRTEYGTIIPCYPSWRISQDLSLQLWLSLCARKAAAELKSPTKEQPRVFLLNPPLADTLSFLRDRVARADLVSVDIETGRGQINTVGFAVSAHEAIAINVLPDRLSNGNHYELWQAVARILESDIPKVLQNFIYEQLFFSRYGIRLRGVTHDTMIAQKFLWPEFEMGLDAVGRMYSEMPYWKDDGKSWNNVRDWEKHYEYNCKDTTGTYEGYLGQRVDLQERGLTDLYDNYICKLFPAITEMCSRGIPFSLEKLSTLKKSVADELGDTGNLLRTLQGAELLNPRSAAQVKTFLQAEPRKYALPKKYDSKEKRYKESTDEKSLKKLRLKYPADEALPLLLKFAKLNKAHSSYLSFGYDPDFRMRFSLNAHGTETGRFAGYCDPWDNGVNPQTIPGGNKGINVKEIFEASPGFLFLQCDLKQAESRFVAYDSADANLISTLEDPSRDIHREVAAEIYGKPVSEITKAERQLGKKSGHGANYSMKEATFMDSCLSEMDLVLTRTEATKVLEAYHRLFPGIRQWHVNIRRELAQTRSLRTPLGRVRQFWGRLDDDMFRQAYAYRPQSTIPDITNHLMLCLLEERAQGKYDFRLLLQCHDSLLLEVPEGEINKIAEVCLTFRKWHPPVTLAGGQLWIPTSVEVGHNWGKLSEYEKSKETS